MNLNIWDIMAPAFFELLILVGIHSYLGLHVIRRKVIFVDLALAQIAALGTTVGFLFGIMPGSTGAYWFSLSFTFIGAAVFSVSRIRNEKIPQEAVIGLAYAIAAAVVILVIDKAPHGAEHIKEILTGSILWVKWSSIRNAAIVYSIVGVFHFIYRKQFLLISTNPEKAYSSGMNVKFWDFLFYVSFGIVITHSVGTAGVLLVFVFLIVPAITAMLITDILWKQLLIGWGMGVIVSVIGLFISYYADLPSGPTVVSVYGLVLILVALTFFFIKASDKLKAAFKIIFGIAAVLAVSLMLYWMGHLFGDKHHDHEKEEIHSAQIESVNPKKINGDTSNSIEQLKKEFDETEDDYSKIDIAAKIYTLDKKTGANLLLSILKKTDFPFVLDETVSKLNELSNKNFNIDSTMDTNQKIKGIKQIENWINSL